MIPVFVGLASVALAGVVRVPTGPVVADGTTTHDVRLWTDTPGERLKIAPQTGALGPVSVVADGVVTARWTPAAVTSGATVPWTVTAGKQVFTV